jgi:hypothetical protein
MTMLVVASVIAFALGFGAGKVKLRRGPVNIVGGMLLPHPGDERWRRVNVDYDIGWGLGAVAVRHHSVFNDWRLYVDGDRVPWAAGYCKAVYREQQERKALAAALGE